MHGGFRRTGVFQQNQRFDSSGKIPLPQRPALPKHRRIKGASFCARPPKREFLPKTGKVATLPLPRRKHWVITAAARKSNSVERFSRALRQRRSRLARSAVIVFEGLGQPPRAIRDFLCRSNLTRTSRSLQAPLHFALRLSWSAPPGPSRLFPRVVTPSAHPGLPGSFWTGPRA